MFILQAKKTKVYFCAAKNHPMELNPQFAPQLNLVIEILKQHKVKNAYLFGSVLTDRFNDQSDIDLLVNYEDFG
ncbi:MAG: nucleotidyltransferase domain-containing protein [Bacteroidales bacterium]|nr:nucleotidyltransferase domain-containing protein [Bacteroidales bacterium]